MNKMTIYEYTALNNPIGAKNVLNSFGEKAVPRPDILARQLANAVQKHGKDALYRIASVHPDLELISEYEAANSAHEEPKKESETCGCKKEESIFSSAEGQEIKNAVNDLQRRQDLSNQPKEKSDSKDLMIIGAVAVIALALITRK